jgi:serine O-acetyltransferase
VSSIAIVEAAYAGDPAARSVDEVLLCYPSIIAIIHHRIAHTLYKLNAPLVARIIAEIAIQHPRSGRGTRRRLHSAHGG